MGRAVFPPCYLTWGQTKVEVMKIMDLLQKVPCRHRYIQCPQPCSRPPLTHASARDSWTLLGKSGSVPCGGRCSFLPGPGAHMILPVPSQSLFPTPVQVLAALWWVNGDLLQEGLCHARVCCTQSPCRSPLPTRTSAGDAHTQLCLSLCGVSGSWCPCLSALSISGGNGV